MTALKSLLTYFKSFTKGDVFGVFAMMCFVLYVKDFDYSATLLIMLFVVSGVIAMISLLIDGLFPAVPKINVPELAEDETYVIVNNSTGIVLDAYKGDIGEPNIQYIKQAMDESVDGSFLDVYGVITARNMPEKYMTLIIGEHADEVFKESLAHQGFKKTWKALEA